MSLDTTGTLLTISVMGVPFYSARGLTQTLSPIQAIRNNRNNLRRTIGGTLVNLTPTQFLKYSTKITCRDQQPPAIDDIWPGTPIVVSCVAELSYPVGGTPQRPEVSGSSVTVDGFVHYRPVLTMMIVDLDENLSEWDAQYSWSLELEEI